MADRFDVAAVWIEHGGAGVAWVVLRTRTRRAVVAATCRQGRRVESVDRGPILGRNSHMDVALDRLPPSDRAGGHPPAAEADVAGRARLVETGLEPLDPQGPERGLVERQRCLSFDRQTTGLQVRAALRDRFTRQGTPGTKRVASCRGGSGASPTSGRVPHRRLQNRRDSGNGLPTIMSHGVPSCRKRSTQARLSSSAILAVMTGTCLAPPGSRPRPVRMLTTAALGSAATAS